MRKYFITFFFIFLFLKTAYSFPLYEVLKDQINVRLDSSISSSSLGFLIKGEKVEVLEKKFEWYKIRIPKRFIFYISKEFLKEIDENTAEVTAVILNVRDKPSLTANIVGKVQKGDILSVVERGEEWVKISAYPCLSGWVNETFMRKITDIDPENTALNQEIKQMVVQLSEASMSKKRDLHLKLVGMGINIIPILETYLPSADINTAYSLIWIIGRIGQENSELALFFLTKIESGLKPLPAGIYLDIIQDIVQPKEGKVSYFYFAQEGKLSAEDVKKSKSYLHEAYNKRFSVLHKDVMSVGKAE